MQQRKILHQVAKQHVDWDDSKFTRSRVIATVQQQLKISTSAHLTRDPTQNGTEFYITYHPQQDGYKNYVPEPTGRSATQIGRVISNVL